MKEAYSKLKELVLKDPWLSVFWLAIFLFVFLRSITLMSFPIFNDEAIYLQYSQAMKEYWSRFKYVSMQGVFGDWKPPLQYWLGSVALRFGNDPLLAGRLLAFAYSLLGIVGIYLLAKEIFGKKEGTVAALIWAISPAIILYNDQFIAETFIFSTAPWFYWLLLRGINKEKIKIGWAIAAIIPGAMLLLFKQSGTVLLLLASALPLMHLPRREVKLRDRKNDQRMVVDKLNLYSWFLRFMIVLDAILISWFIFRGIIPQEYNAIRGKFDKNWLMSFGEVMALPWSTWRNNAISVVAYYYKYYSLFLLPFLIAFFIEGIWKKSLKHLSLFSMLLGASFAIVVLLRGFNEYIYNTAAIMFLALMAARGMVWAWESAKKKLFQIAFILLLVALAGNWSYQIFLMSAAPGKYFERGTPWMVANYLKTWPTGFGVKETIKYLEEMPQPGIVFTDVQWGNPRTALEVYNDRYPKLELVRISLDFSTPESILKLRKYILASRPGSRAVVFSSSEDERRVVWQRNIEKYLCDQRTEIKRYPSQAPIVICRF